MPVPKIDAEAVEHNDYEKSSKPLGRTPSDDTLNYGNRDAHRPSTRQPSVAALLCNPLAGMSDAEVLRDVDTFVDNRGLQDYRDEFRKGGLLARVQQREDRFEWVDMLNEEEKEILRYEKSHRWSQPWKLYFLVILCAGSAIVQGMDQTGMYQIYLNMDRADICSCQWCSSVLLRRIRHYE